MTAISKPAYFSLIDGVYTPLSAAKGPWAEDMIHGGAVCGVIAHALEQQIVDLTLIPARLNVELLRPVKQAAVTINVTCARDGRLIKAFDAELIQNDTVCARAQCLMIQPGDQPEGERWTPADWNVSAPESFDPVPNLPRDTRLISGSLRSNQQRRAWVREVCDIVSNSAITPFQRIAATADFASPFSSSGTSGLSFINCDVSLALHRLPQGEWVGVEVVDHQSTQGIAVGSCRIYDQTGHIGVISTVGLSRRKALPLDGKSPTGENS